MKKSCEVLGLTLVSIQEGKELGTVKQLIIDASSGVVAGLLIDDGQWYLGAKAIRFSSISGLGEYAVTINSEADIIQASEFDQLLLEKISVIGSLVLNRKGYVVGTVTEIVLDGKGKITECLVETDGDVRSLPGQLVITYGKDVLIAAEEESEIQNVRQNKLSFATKPAEIVVPETPVIEPVIEPITEEVPVVQDLNEEPAGEGETDALAKMFEEKQRKYMLGKRANRRIESENGVLIIDQGEEVTEAVIQKAKLSGKFVELSMSIN